MNALAQSTTETEILNLSTEKFRWKTEGKIDLVADLFDDELVFVHITEILLPKANG